MYTRLQVYLYLNKILSFFTLVFPFSAALYFYATFIPLGNIAVYSDRYNFKFLWDLIYMKDFGCEFLLKTLSGLSLCDDLPKRDFFPWWLNLNNIWSYWRCMIFRSPGAALTFIAAVDIIPQSLRWGVAPPSRGKRLTVSLLFGRSRAHSCWLLSQIITNDHVFFLVFPSCKLFW